MEENKTEIQTYYSNHVEVVSSLFDFTLKFGVMGEDGNPSTNSQITMSPQHAKAFLNALNESISRYEETFGTIVIKPKK